MRASQRFFSSSKAASFCTGTTLHSGVSSSARKKRFIPDAALSGRWGVTFNVFTPIKIALVLGSQPFAFPHSAKVEFSRPARRPGCRMG